jgi:hypothetical protein
MKWQVIYMDIYHKMSIKLIIKCTWFFFKKKKKIMK